MLNDERALRYQAIYKNDTVTLVHLGFRTCEDEVQADYGRAYACLLLVLRFNSFAPCKVLELEAKPLK